MNGHLLIKALECVEKAFTSTFDPVDRGELRAISKLLRAQLQARGVFIGRIHCQLCGGTQEIKRKRFWIFNRTDICHYCP